MMGSKTSLSRSKCIKQIPKIEDKSKTILIKWIRISRDKNSIMIGRTNITIEISMETLTPTTNIITTSSLCVKMRVKTLIKLIMRLKRFGNIIFRLKDLTTKSSNKMIKRNMSNIIWIKLWIYMVKLRMITMNSICMMLNHLIEIILITTMTSKTSRIRFMTNLIRITKINKNIGNIDMW
jgi:hypothetical protein